LILCAAHWRTDAEFSYSAIAIPLHQTPLQGGDCADRRADEPFQVEGVRRLGHPNDDRKNAANCRKTAMQKPHSLCQVCETLGEVTELLVGR
jgi:hypothetical protein